MMFLFSSTDFLQAYKRIQYIKQYANFRKKQGELIAEKTETLQILNNALLEQKTKKQGLVEENKKAQQILMDERKSQQRLIRSLKFKSRSLSANIKENCLLYTSPSPRDS